ncbi:zinc finger BED domain-containing protein RICESLEEPER 2-like [Camellia sinensis]|uniref:zinc finger BED domain-containing protein RICESLEEPER 2-like n=1 Tax=Camellia sinensis TaxID=4442 RepID=UPI001035B05B|nr:zinc finger BED domain-containing protein RICESLEEPER 2-like [Camellia sinensis]
MVSNRQKNPEVFPTPDPTIPKDPNKKNKMKSKFKRKKPETQSSDQPNIPKHCSKKSHWEKNKMDESTSGEPKTQEPKKLNLGIVWDHFTRLDCEHGENPRAACNYCGMDYACDPKVNGTKLMLTHIESRCKEYPLRQDENQTTTLGFEPKRETVDGETIGDLVAASFSVDACRKALVEMFIIDELPFKFVEGEGFKRFMRVVQPKWLTIPSRITIANDCKSIFVREKAALKNALRGQRICLTTGTWTSVQNLKYLCLIAHFIDCDWKLNKKILNFRLVPNHRGKTLGRVIEGCLSEWGIDKLLTITVDNASSNNGVINFLKRWTKDRKNTILEHEFLHVKCCAHIVNLIVCESLKEIDDSITRIRNIVKYVKSSPSRMAEFKFCVKLERIEYEGQLCLDVATRWNSTYFMLERALQFQKAFERLEDDDTFFHLKFREDEIAEEVGEGGEGVVGVGGANSGKGKEDSKSHSGLRQVMIG